MHDLHIRALSSDGRRSPLVTTEGPFNMCPTVSLDGDQFAFFSNRDGTMKIYVAHISGAQVRRLTDDDREEYFPQFGPEGKWVYYWTHDEQKDMVRRAPVSGGPSEPLIEGNGVTVSPDGRRLLVQVDSGDDRLRYVLVPTSGGDPELLELEFFDLEDVEEIVRWSPDGTALTASRWDGSEASVWVVPLDGSEPRKITSFSHGRIRTLAWNAAGDSLAVVTSWRYGDLVLVRGL